MLAPREITAGDGLRMPSRVPEITVIFWIVKVLSTGMGETTSDFFVRLIDPVVAVAFGALALAIALALQFTRRRYVPWAYWLAVVMVSVFGTMAADVLHIGLGIPYFVSTAFFAVVLAAIFVVWRRVEGTLSIHSITTSRREFFYWATVLSTFALGTAAGDLTATTLRLGFFVSGVLFAALITVPAIAFRWFRLSSIFAFWFAYIVTRPLGASFADWMGLPPERGGLGFGTGPVSATLAGIIAILVCYLTVTRRYP